MIQFFIFIKDLFIKALHLQNNAIKNKDDFTSRLNFILNINLKSTSTGSLIFVMERTSFRSRVRNRCFQRQPVSEQFVDT